MPVALRVRRAAVACHRHNDAGIAGLVPPSAV